MYVNIKIRKVSHNRNWNQIPILITDLSGNIFSKTMRVMRDASATNCNVNIHCKRSLNFGRKNAFFSSNALIRPFSKECRS